MGQDVVEYRAIPDFPGYRVGTDGSVWTSIVKGSRPRKYGEWRKLSPEPNGDSGHLAVGLYDANGVRRRRFVHRLVLEAFVGPCPVGMEACHFPDRNPANNNLNNLRWDTKRANQADRKKHGTACFGESHGLAKLKEADISEIKRHLAEKLLSLDKIAVLFKVSRKAISRIRDGITWKHVESRNGIMV